jgi:outer membrane protein assembly factor BamB
MRIIRDGRVADVNGLDGLRFDVARITITPQKVFALTEPAARLAAVDTATGQVAWNVQVAPSTLDFAVGDNHVAAIESHANRSAVVIRNRDSGATTLTRELPGEGIWLQPTPFGNKVFLAEDTAWQLHLLDTTTGDFAYVLTFHGTFPRPPTLHDGTLYLHVRAYKERTIYLYAIVPDTGQVLWKTDLQAMSVHSPPIFRGPDIVYLNPETYRIFLIDRQTGVRHAEASFEELMTKQQRDFLQFMRPFGDRLLLVGGRGDIHAFTVVPGGEPSR